MNLHIQTYPDITSFLKRTQSLLEQDELTNNLILGICLRLRNQPSWGKGTPYLATVQWEGEIIVAAVMTPPYRLTLTRFSKTPLPSFRIVARNLMDSKWEVPGVLAAKDIARAFAAIWGDLSGELVKPGRKQRLYRLDEVHPPSNVPGHLRLAGKSDLTLVTRWMTGFRQDTQVDPDIRVNFHSLAQTRIQHGDIFLWVVQGQPVSMAAKTRPTRHGISISMVYTPPNKRNRGYASACVAALSQRLLTSGFQWCSLFTDLDNPTSNRIYQRIGYRPVCDFENYIFSTQ
jgi:hypothetical protein